MDNQQAGNITVKKILRCGLTAGGYFAVGFGSMVAVKLPDNLAPELPSFNTYVILGGAAVAFFTAAIVCAASLLAAPKVARDIYPFLSPVTKPSISDTLAGFQIVLLGWAVSSVALIVYAAVTVSQKWSPFEIFLVIPLWCGITAPFSLAHYACSVYKSSAAR